MSTAPLNQAAIQQALLCGQAVVFAEIDSTNEYLLRQLEQLPTGSLCLAECQTAGRGRRGRQWFSPVGQNLYFSLLWRYDKSLCRELASLSLLVAVVIAETFQQLNIEGIQIKWPNDIYYQGKKMGGILIESKIEPTQVHLVIGIGLNLAMAAVDTAVVTQPWADLSAYAIDRNALAAELAQRLQQALTDFPHQTFAAYLPRWQAFDLFYQQPVKLITASGEIHGISQGINAQGELLLQQGTQLTPYAIGEISLRAG